MRVFPASTLGFLSLCAAALLAAGPHKTDGPESQIDSLFSGITQPCAPGLALLVKKDGFGIRNCRRRFGTYGRLLCPRAILGCWSNWSHPTAAQERRC